MPVLPSSAKALRRDRRRTQVNRQVRLELKQALDALKKKPSASNLSLSYQAIDRAAKKGVIHANKTARLKAQTAKLAAHPPAKAVKAKPKKKAA